MPDSPARLLARLQRRQAVYDAATGAEKLALLRALERRMLGRAVEVDRLHETLCFLRAYPDNEKVLGQVERMLWRFSSRRDLRRYRRALESSGIAGTTIRYRFYAATASWLARRWPGQLSIDWQEFASQELLEHLLPLLVHYGETPAIEECAYPLREWIQRLKGRSETDAAFLVRRFERLRMDDFAREILFDQVDPPLVLTPGLGTPSRTTAKHPVATIAYQRRALSRSRPLLRDEIRRPLSAIRVVDSRQGHRLIDLARAAMVTRQRDLDAFAYGDPADVRMIDAGEGLQFACIGVIPERRLLLEAVYGYLTLKNGVPIGYVLSGALFHSAEVAYNVFETYRAAESGIVYGRVLAMIHRLFDADGFTIPPYQLGDDNDEAIASGAWWFYRKFGFGPRDPAVLRLMRREERRLATHASLRSSPATLKRLAKAPVFYHLGAVRENVMGRVELANVGLAVSRYLADRFGADRERAAHECSREAAAFLGVRSMASWPAGERRAWERWSPLVMVLPGLRRWTPTQRRALVAVIRAKGGRRESDYVRLFDRHLSLARAVVQLARQPVTPPAGRS